METTINDLIPFIDIDPDNNILLGRNGEMTVGFKIQMPPIFTKELNYYNYIHKALTNMISSLPNYCRLHKQDFFTLQEIQLPGNTYLGKRTTKNVHRQTNHLPRIICLPHSNSSTNPQC